MAIPQTGVAQSAGPGSGIVLRESKELAQVISQGCGKYYEGTSRATVFSGTSTTGRAPGTALGATPSILLYNPLGSGKRYEILKVAVSQGLSGTAGSGGMYHCGFTLSGPVGSQNGTVPAVGSGAAITPLCNDIGATAVTAAVLFSLGTLAQNPVVLYPAFQIGEAVSQTTTNSLQPCVEDVDGAIVLEQGCGWCLEGIAAAGSSPLVFCGVVWRESPYAA